MNLDVSGGPVVATKTAATRKIYLNAKLSGFFGVDYHNDSQKTVIHTSALDRADENWDEAHQAIIDQGGELLLEGAGYGWWNIIG